MSHESYLRLSKRGRRRAVAVKAVEGIIYTALFAALGYLCCLVVYGLELLTGVA